MQSEAHNHSRIVENVHCTFAFRPTAEQIAEFLPYVGKRFDLSVVGYGADEQNSGFSVSIPSDLLYLYHGSIQPHITTSLADDGRAVNTGKLSFSPIDSFSVVGTMGLFTETGIIC